VTAREVASRHLNLQEGDMPSRTWTVINEADPRIDEEYIERNRARADALAREWSEANDQIERDAFDRENDREAGRDLYDLIDWPQRNDYESTEEYDAACKAAKAQYEEAKHDRRVREEQLEVRKAFCEAQLKELGFRIERPYESWNEEERYREMAESGVHLAMP
jgi:hypothetical protein